MDELPQLQSKTVRNVYGVWMVVKDSIGNLLVVIEGNKKPRKSPGDISVPAGETNQGESGDDTCRRELREEVGLSIPKDTNCILRGNVNLIIISKSEIINVIGKVFHITLSTERPRLQLQQEELQNAYWEPIDKVLSERPCLDFNGSIRLGILEVVLLERGKIVEVIRNLES